MSESYIAPRWFEIVETVDAWCNTAIDHVEDPGDLPVTSEFRVRTEKLKGWCVEFHIDPKPIWETYCQSVAARMPGGAFGPRRSQEYMEETYRGAILSCDLLRACVKSPADGKNVYLTRPHFAVLVAFENAVLAANPRPLCVEYEFGPSSP